MILLVTGDRHWKDELKISRAIFKRRKKLKLVIQGGARGADLIAKNRAELLGIPTATCDANWTFYKKVAGPIRNNTMLQMLLAYRAAGEKVMALAFHSHLERSKGTANMVRQLKKENIQVKVIR